MLEELEENRGTEEAPRSAHWVRIDLLSLQEPAVVDKHFAELLQEGLASPSKEGRERTHTFPDFGASSLKREALHVLCSNLWQSLREAVRPLGRTPSAVFMFKQRAVLSRVIRAMEAFYSKDNLKKTVARIRKADELSGTGKEGESERQKPGNMEGMNADSILVETGVRTALSVVFSLLRQAWAQLAWQRQLEEQLKQTGALSLPFPPASNLPNEVLQSVLDIMKTLPPLTLSNRKALSSLSLSCLEQAREFLQSVLGPESLVDGRGKQLATETLLRLALQEGSLTSLLNWIAFCTECLKRHQREERDECRAVTKPYLSLECCHDVLGEISRKAVSVVTVHSVIVHGIHVHVLSYIRTCTYECSVCTFVHVHKHNVR